MKKITFSFAIFMLVLSCSKNDNFTKQKKLLLKRVLINEETIHTYTYVNNSVSSYSFHDDGEVIYTVNYKYEKDTIYEKNSNNRSYKYYMTSEDTLRKDNFFSDTILTLYNIYSFNNYLYSYFSKTTYDNNDRLVRHNEISKYMDDSCSIIRTEYNSENEVTSTTEIISLEKKPPNKRASLKSFKSSNFGNIISYIKKNSDGIANLRLSYTASFEYYMYGYPLYETRTYFDGSVNVYSYEYY